MSDDQLTHWENWANEFKQNLRATTKTGFVKELEIRELTKSIDKYVSSDATQKTIKVLEVGCGNGYNVLALAKQYRNFLFHGVDFSSSMIDNAQKNLSDNSSLKNCSFFIADARNLGNCSSLSDEYDIIFTNRCLINLKEDGDTFVAINEIHNRLVKGGKAIFIENFIEGREAQNQCRKEIGLEARPVPEFNKFLSKASFESMLNSRFKDVHIECISSLHDFILYVLSPLLSKDKSVDYDNILSKATALLLQNRNLSLKPDIGQNYIATAIK